MEKTKRSLKLCTCLFLAAFILGTAAQQLSAQVTIPQDSIVNSAVFSIYETYALGEINQLVTLRRVTADWGECSVTFENLAGQYDAIPAGSFLTNTYSWRTVDLTALVQAWVNGAPNFGFIMMQEPNIPITAYKSSEAVDLDLRPKLEIWYTTPQGDPGHAIIQRTDATPYEVADTYVRDEVNYCSSGELATGNLNGVEKYSLVRFHFTVVPPSLGEGCTPGFWKNHLGDWLATGYAPTDFFNTVFGVSYFPSSYTLLDAINQGGGGIKVIARHGTAALLSAAHPDVNYPFTIAEVIAFVQAGTIGPLVEANELGCYIPERR